MLYDLLGYLRRAKDRRPSLFDVYGRFSLEFSPGVRGDALRHLGRTALFRFHGGDRMVRYSRYLRERSEEHTSELQSQSNLVCRLLLEKKKKYIVPLRPRHRVKHIRAR